MGKFIKGHKLSEKSRNKIGEANKYRIITKECREKHRIQMIGNQHKKGKVNPVGSRKGALKEKNYQWKGGKTAIGLIIRSHSRYAKWRQDIFIRDNFICQKCGQFGGELEAHHIKPFSILLDEIKRNLPLFSLYNGAMIYTPLWDINNGITLCIKCHRKNYTS